MGDWVGHTASWDGFTQALFPAGESSPTVTLSYYAVLLLLAGLEFLIPQFPRARRVDRWPVNFGLGMINMALVSIAPISVLWASNWAQRHHIGVLNLLDGSWWFVVVIATIAVLSLADYARHWLCHKMPWLWRIHRVHHFDTAVDVSTGLRHHPLEVVIALSVDVPVAVLFGAAPWVAFMYAAADAFFALLAHANVRLPAGLDRILGAILVTPRIHAVHHSARPIETDSNYGSVFSIWDRLFGTFCVLRRGDADAMQFGLAELRDRRAADLWWQLKSPIYRAATPASALSAQSAN